MGRWSRRDVNRLRTRMIEQGRGTDEIAEEIRHLTGCSRLAAYRMATGLSQPEVVERYAEVAPGSVIDQPLLSRFEAFPALGSRPPQAAHLITLAAIYDTTPLRLLAPEALDRLDERERAVLIRCSAALTSPTVDLSHDRREPVVPIMPRPRPSPAVGYLERQVVMAARKALRFAARVEGSNLGPETLDQLRDEVARLALAYPQKPLPVLLGDLIAVQDVAFRLLDGRQRPAETAELYLLTGAVCGMLAKASHDLGEPHAAMTQARTAHICADNAGHDGLRAWTRGLQSLIAYWAGWPNDAIRYARLGAEAGARTRGSAAVWLAAQEARAVAVLGEADKVEDAIARAARAREQVRGDDLDALGGIMTFTRPRQLYYAADARVWLPGAEGQAERAAGEAIAAYEHADPAERSFSDEAGAHAAQAVARVNLGDLAGAAEALRPVLDLPPERRIGGIVASVMRVHAALREPRHRATSLARDVQEEIEAYCQASATRAR